MGHIDTAALVLERLVSTPALVERVRGLAPSAFARLVREVGVEDAGPLVALATTAQLVAAFDEDLFGNVRPGERETFDVARFATWLEVLLEGNAAAVAQRVAELDLDFVAHAVGELALVLDREALVARMADAEEADARRADRAIDDALSEEIDGYVLVARRADGWDALMALVAALDRDARDVLVRVLDRCAAAQHAVVDDLAKLAGVLSEQDSLVDDVEAAREARRAAGGYIEPRAAKAFLATAPSETRDPITRAYFRELVPTEPTDALDLPDEVAALVDDRALPAPLSPVIAALRTLSDDLYTERMRELAYLANVVMAGATPPTGGRYDAHAASAFVLDTIARAAALRGVAIEVALAAVPADRLFREAYSTM